MSKIPFIICSICGTELPMKKYGDMWYHAGKCPHYKKVPKPKVLPLMLKESWALLEMILPTIAKKAIYIRFTGRHGESMEESVRMLEFAQEYVKWYEGLKS
jgi:hypothetical protein